MKMNLKVPQNIYPLSRQSAIDQLEFVPGIWVNGKYYWMHNSSEKVIFEEELIIKVKLELIHSKIRFSSIYVSSHSVHPKEIKVLGMYYFSNVNQDHLAFISPTDKKIFHISKNNIFLVNAQFKGELLKEYTTVPVWSAYTDQIWSSVPAGTLKYQPMAKGPAASILAVKMTIHSRETCKLNSWTISGSNKNELLSMEQALLKNPLAFPFEK
jgi:hypothetical protein